MSEQVHPSFTDLELNETTRKALADMGFELPTPVQSACVPAAVQGRDLIVQAQTGTGKTAAFGIPIVDRIVAEGGGVQALGLAPTRELAIQSSEEINRLAKYSSIKTLAIYGGAGMEAQVRALSAGVDIVSGTPGRVLDHLRQKTLDVSKIRVLVLDEADEMLSMGFIEDLNAIVDFLPAKRQTLLFSATIDGAVRRIADRMCTDPLVLALSSDAVGAQGVSHYVYLVTGSNRVADLVSVLEVEDPETAFIFCNTKVETEQVARELQRRGFNADWINGDLPQKDREAVLARSRSGQLRFLVATDVAARGIDISHVTHVINYNFPASAEQYVHRSGRTGRAGRTGAALSLIGPTDIGHLYYLRLQFKIYPIERSLPNRSEWRTRHELDRLDLVKTMATERATDMDRAVAQRVLDHPEAQTYVAGMLASLFGALQADPDETARRHRLERSAEVNQDGPEINSPRPTRPSRPRNTPQEQALSTPKDTSTDGNPPNQSASRGSETSTAERSKPKRARAEKRVPSSAKASSEQDAAPPSDLTLLYVNLGKQNGFTRDDICSVIDAHTTVSSAHIKRINLRERYAFIELPSEASEEVMSALNGFELEGLVLKVERAKRL